MKKLLILSRITGCAILVTVLTMSNLNAQNNAEDLKVGDPIAILKEVLWPVGDMMFKCPKVVRMATLNNETNSQYQAAWGTSFFANNRQFGDYLNCTYAHEKATTNCPFVVDFKDHPNYQMGGIKELLNYSCNTSALTAKTSSLREKINAQRQLAGEKSLAAGSNATAQQKADQLANGDFAYERAYGKMIHGEWGDGPKFIDDNCFLIAPAYQDVNDVINFWKQNPVNNQLLLSPIWKNVTVSVACKDNAKFKTYWVAVFSK